MIKDFHKIAIMAQGRDISYTEMLQRISLYAQFTPQQAGAKTIVFSENRPGWIYAFFSIWQNRGIAIPVDASSTVDDLAYILSDCRPECIWCSQEREATARQAIEAADVDTQVHIIEEREDSDLPEGAFTQTLEDFQKQKEKTAVIIYTSGTTGNPKGVMLSYSNLWANMAGVCEEVQIFNAERRAIILLPIHHVLPLMGTMIIPIVMGGGVIICPSMSGPDIMECLCRGQVAIFVGVPRLWQTLYNGIKKKIDASAVTRGLFSLCAKMQNRTLSRLVFGSVRRKMGGHIDFCVSGGAALDREIGEGLRTLGLDVLEGYGMTETSPIIAFTRPGDIIPGCSGRPLPSVECKIVNGELYAKGPNVMQGYYNRPEETAAVLDSDGYIHTGDLAQFDEEGRVYITGRSKEIIVLSNGKNVQPSEIEFKLESFQTQVKEAAVVQDGDMLRALIVPQEIWARTLSAEQMQEALKREVLEPYNATVENYKKIMGVYVYHGDLPRTKLDKLQRFKLKDILLQCQQQGSASSNGESAPEPELAEYHILKEYIEGEKKLPVHPTDHLETDLAFDSLDKVGLQGFIEQTFGMEVPADTMAAYANVEALANHIASAKTRMEVGEIDWHSILTTNAHPVQLPHTSLLLPVHAKLFKVYFQLHNRLCVKGIQNIPSQGPFILAPNHQSYVDGPLAMAGLSARTIKECYFYATERHVKSSLRKYLARRNNIIIMERSDLKNSILKLAEVLKQGKNVIIFPEGSRTHDGKISAFKKTFAILSKELQVPIVPVCIRGAFEALPRGTKWITTHRIEVEYLPAVQPTEADTYTDLSELIKSKIAEAGSLQTCLE